MLQAEHLLGDQDQKQQEVHILLSDHLTIRTTGQVQIYIIL